MNSRVNQLPNSAPDGHYGPSGRGVSHLRDGDALTHEVHAVLRLALAPAHARLRAKAHVSQTEPFEIDIVLTGEPHRPA